MAQRIDKIIVVDLEATCWDDQKQQGNQENEIIEIGICLLDVATGERTNKESIMVKPESSTVSSFCTKLTTLTQEDVDKGISLEDACEYIKKTHGKKRLWASYGDYDRRQFEKECKSKGITYPFGVTHLNVKNLFALRKRLSKEVGMDKAMNILGEKLEGTHHRGDDDAWNIALILSKVI